MEAPPPRPIAESYWVSRAGFSPGSIRVPPTRRLRRASSNGSRTAGIDFFLDLTEPAEHGLRPYEPDLRGGLIYRRMQVPDLGVPSREWMVAILDAIDEALAQGHNLYLHCAGGIGRTATVVGCWLVRHGETGEQALRLIRESRSGTPNGHRRHASSAR